IAIRALKRFVDDRYGVYLGETGEVRKPPAWPTYVGTTAASIWATRRCPRGAMRRNLRRSKSLM
ncbi:MAG TPA: hypothetical protein VLG46_14940, partial [Anaerolineae bacterium]|nr:hypothetical protein [Anaerolineae bacterium]